MIHDVTIQPRHLDAILDGRKTFLVHDAGSEESVAVGDHLRLMDTTGASERDLVVEVTYTEDLGDGRVVLAIHAQPSTSDGPVS